MASVYGFNPMDFQATEAWKNAAFRSCRGTKTHLIEEVGSGGVITTREVSVHSLLKGVMRQYWALLWTQYVADPSTEAGDLKDRAFFYAWLEGRRAALTAERAFNRRKARRAEKARALDAEGIVDRSYKGRIYKVSGRGLAWRSVRQAIKEAKASRGLFGISAEKSCFSPLLRLKEEIVAVGGTPTYLPVLSRTKSKSPPLSEEEISALPFLGLRSTALPRRNGELLAQLRAKIQVLVSARTPLAPAVKQVVKTPGSTEDQVVETRSVPRVGCSVNGRSGVPRNPTIQRILRENPKILVGHARIKRTPPTFQSSGWKKACRQALDPKRWVIYPLKQTVSRKAAYRAAEKVGLLADFASATERVSAMKQHFLALSSEIAEAQLQRETLIGSLNPTTSLARKLALFFFEEGTLAADEARRARLNKEIDQRGEHIEFLRHLRREARRLYEQEVAERNAKREALEKAISKMQEPPPASPLLLTFTPQWHVCDVAARQSEALNDDKARAAYCNRYLLDRQGRLYEKQEAFRAKCLDHFERLYGWRMHVDTTVPPPYVWGKGSCILRSMQESAPTTTLTQVQSESPPPVIVAPTGHRLGGNSSVESAGSAAVRAAMHRAVERNRPGAGETQAMPSRDPLLSHRGEYYARSLRDRYMNVFSRANAYNLMRETDVPIMEFSYGQQQDISIPLSNRFDGHPSLHVGELEIAIQSAVLSGVDTAMAILVTDASHDHLEEGFLALTILRLGAGWMRHTIPIGLTVFRTDPHLDRLLRLSVLTGGSPMADGRQVARLHYGLLGQAYTGAGEQRLTQYASRRISARQTHVTQFLEGNHIHIARSEDQQQALPHMNIEYRPISGSTRYVARSEGYAAIENGRQSVDIQQHFIRMPTHLMRSATSRELSRMQRDPVNVQREGSTEAADTNREVPQELPDVGVNSSSNLHSGPPRRGRSVERGYQANFEQAAKYIEHKFVPGFSALTPGEDIALFTKSVDIPSTSSFCAEIARIPVIPEALGPNGTAFGKLLRQCPMVRAHYRFIFRLVTPILESVPVMATWDDCGILTTKVSLLSSNFTIIDSDHTRAAVMEVRPSGPTDLITPYKSIYGGLGDLVIFSGGYGTSALNATLSLKIEAFLTKDSQFGSGELLLTQGPSSMLNFTYLEEVDLGDLDLSIFLGSCKYTSKSPKGGRNYLAVCPAAGIVHAKGKAAYMGLGPSLFSMYNFWRGRYVLRVEILAKGTCAGSVSILVPPVGSSAESVSNSQLNALPKYELSWRGAGYAQFEVENYCWIQWQATKPLRYLTNEDWNSLLGGLVIALDQPPVGRVGTTSDVRLIFRIIKFKNLRLKEKSTLCDIYAGFKERVYSQPLVDALDEVISLTGSEPSMDVGSRGGEPALSIEAGPAPNFGAYYAYLRCGSESGKSFHTFCLPITLGNPLMDLGSTKLVYANTAKATDRIILNLRNPLVMLCSASAYYLSDVLITAVVDCAPSSKKFFMSMGIARSSLFKDLDGHSFSDEKISEGGLYNVVSCGHKSYAQIYVPKRTFRARATLSQVESTFFETLGLLSVKVSAHDEVRGVHVYFEPVGEISVDGYGFGKDVALTSADQVYMPAMRKS